MNKLRLAQDEISALIPQIENLRNVDPADDKDGAAAAALERAMARADELNVVVDRALAKSPLRRYATAMDCELVYVLLPKRPLGDVVSERAAEVARARLAGNGHSDDPAVFETQVEQLRQKLLVGRRSEIWKRLGPAS
jgi:hypothetical protein